MYKNSRNLFELYVKIWFDENWTLFQSPKESMPWCHSLLRRIVLGTLLVTVVPSSAQYKSTTIHNYPMYHENLRNVPDC